MEIPAGILRLSGKNAVQFLNGLVSNDVKTLEPGGGVLAAFPTLQRNRIISSYSMRARKWPQAGPVHRPPLLPASLPC